MLDNKIVVLMPYYGAWPSYFSLFLDGCRRNPWIDFIFFTDLDCTIAVPDNVRFVSMDFLALRNMFEQKLGMSVALEKPYKLCDFKPAYGYLFAEYIQAYTYWGHGDIDLVYGDIALHITEETFCSEAYDIITFREDWISGPLSFFKNTDAVNRLFLQSRDYRYVFSISDCLAFDECGKRFQEIRDGKDITSLPGLCCMTTLLRQAQKTSGLKVWEKKVIKEYIAPEEYVVISSKGVSDSQGNSYLHYHFISEKKKPYYQYPSWSDVPAVYYVTPTGFYTPSEFEQYRWRKYLRKIAALDKTLYGYIDRVKNKVGSLLGDISHS